MQIIHLHPLTPNRKIDDVQNNGLVRQPANLTFGESEMANQTATLTIEFSGDLADSLRAIANLVEEHGPAFLSDPTGFFSIFNDGAVHRVDIDVSETAPIDPSQVW